MIENLGHWGLIERTYFVSDRFWWTGVPNYVSHYAESIHGCQLAMPAGPYRKKLRMPLTGRFDTVSVYFWSPSPVSNLGCNYALIAVEHLTWQLITKPTIYCTSETVREFMRNGVMFRFGPPNTVVSENATYSTAKKRSSYIPNHHIDRKRCCCTRLLAMRREGFWEAQRSEKWYLILEVTATSRCT